MPTTTSCEFGDIILVPFPFSDQTTSKKRPAVVISSAAYHATYVDLIVMAVTSQARPRARLGEAPIKRWREAGLLKPSMLKPVITTVERTLVLRKLGRLAAEDRATLRTCIEAAVGR